MVLLLTVMDDHPKFLTTQYIYLETLCNTPRVFMRDHLPLPEPWNIENVSDYINQLVSFITKYESIAKFNSHDVFLHGLPVGWVGEHSLETWMAIMSGESLDGLSDRVTGEFSEFARLSHACL